MACVIPTTLPLVLAYITFSWFCLVLCRSREWCVYVCVPADDKVAERRWRRQTLARTLSSIIKVTFLVGSSIPQSCRCRRDRSSRRLRYKRVVYMRCTCTRASFCFCCATIHIGRRSLWDCSPCSFSPQRLFRKTGYSEDDRRRRRSRRPNNRYLSLLFSWFANVQPARFYFL